MTLGCTVHHCLLKPCTPVELLCQGHQINRVNKPGYKSPGGAKAPLILATKFPTNILQKWTSTSLHRVTSMIRPFNLPEKLFIGDWSSNFPGKASSYSCFSLQFPHHCIENQGIPIHPISLYHLHGPEHKTVGFYPTRGMYLLYALSWGRGYLLSVIEIQAHRDGECDIFPLNCWSFWVSSSVSNSTDAMMEEEILSSYYLSCQTASTW